MGQRERSAGRTRTKTRRDASCALTELHDFTHCVPVFMQLVRQTRPALGDSFFPSLVTGGRDMPKLALGVAAEFLTGCQAPRIRCLPEKQPQARMGVGLTKRLGVPRSPPPPLPSCQSIDSLIPPLPERRPDSTCRSKYSASIAMQTSPSTTKWRANGVSVPNAPASSRSRPRRTTNTDLPPAFHRRLRRLVPAVGAKEISDHPWMTSSTKPVSKRPRPVLPVQSVTRN